MLGSGGAGGRVGSPRLGGWVSHQAKLQISLQRKHAVVERLRGVPAVSTSSNRAAYKGNDCVHFIVVA